MRAATGDEENFPATTEEGLRLVRAFRLIENAALRHAAIRFVEEISERPSTCSSRSFERRRIASATAEIRGAPVE
jgi:hypothetical protein